MTITKEIMLSRGNTVPMKIYKCKIYTYITKIIRQL